MTTIITERLDFGPETKATGGVIRDVALLRSVSQNCRTYTPKALSDIARLSEGSKVFLDHPTKSELKDRDGIRSIHDLAGSVGGSRFDGFDTVRGTIHLLPQHRELIESLVNAGIPGIGMSIHAEVDQTRSGNGYQVEAVQRLVSIDLVTEAATVSGFFESKAHTLPGDESDYWQELFGDKKRPANSYADELGFTDTPDKKQSNSYAEELEIPLLRGSTSSKRN